MLKETREAFAAKEIVELLYKRGFIDGDQANEILDKKETIVKKLEKKEHQASQKAIAGVRIVNPITIVDVIIDLNITRADEPTVKLDEETIFQILAEEWGYTYKKIDPLKLDLNIVTTTIPRSFAMRHLILPIGIQNGSLTVATSNPFNVVVMDDIARATHLKVQPVVSSKSDIIKLINEFFGFKRSIAAAENQFAGPIVDLGNLEQYVRLKSEDELPSNDQHIVNAVNYLFSYAFEQRASDIHIEPKRDTTIVRMRIDGVLHPVYELPKNVHSAIISRIKNLSRLDMAEKRRPQDGRIKTNKGDIEVEMRISTVPVAFGEKVVMRIMDPDILFQDLETLGFTSTDLIRYNHFINMPHGIILVCGPTGSGKSTTLYSTLKTLSTPKINITTVEDPIEMINEDFNQIAVQPAVGITFASILKTILRQDPDIIMIGEMRDLETAQNAIQASLTGHLVFSTLHTNDSVSSIIRLLDLGVPDFLIRSTVVGIMAQRLVRKICKYCKKSFEIDTAELRALGLKVGNKGRIILHQGKGCVRCRGTGYLGRSAIFEVLPYTPALQDLTVINTDIQALYRKVKEEGMVTLRENAIHKLLRGITTYQEVLRVTVNQNSN